MINISYFIIACLIFMTLDATWIYTNINYYFKLIEKIQKEPIIPKIPAILIVYPFLFITLYFCIRYIELEITDKRNFYLKAIIIAAIFGLGVYGVFSYTNCIFFKNYNYTNAFIDTIWAVVLYSIPTVIYFILKNR